MALLYFDGFESVGSTLDPVDTILSRRYEGSGFSNMRLQTGRFGTGTCLEIRDDASSWIKIPADSTDTTKYFGWSMYWFQEVGTVDELIRLVTDTSFWSIGVRVYKDGTVAIVDNTDTVQAVSKPGKCPAGRWHQMLMKVYCHATAGTIDIWANGENILSVTNFNTVNTSTDGTYHNQIRFFGTGYLLVSYLQLDDIYVLDTSGNYNTSDLGPVTVTSQFPTSDSVSEWTPSSGNDHYAMVDEAEVDDDTTYVSTTTVGFQDIWAYEDLPADADTIKGVKLTTDIRCEGSGCVGVTTVAVSGGTDYTESPLTVTTSWAAYNRYLETDPNTAALWTVTNYNAATFGVEAV